MLIIGHEVVRDVLTGRERDLIEQVRDAYLAHHQGLSTVPQSSFLRFPGQPRDRIIALPAYLGGDDEIAGIKWISSFPGNLERGLDRASAVMVLNSLESGRAEALLEGSLISAKRTAASAALAATLLTDGPTGVGLLGCGVINLEILRFLAAAFPTLAEVSVYDTDPARAAAFADRCAPLVPGGKVLVSEDRDQTVGRHPLVSIATTAATPHMDLRAAGAGAVVLHVSLRDLTTETILGSHNVVDDVDHVCREATSLHLAEQATGGRAFIDATIGELIDGTATVRSRDGRPVVFSPFGLGVLDLALARFVHRHAVANGLGLPVPGFLPGPNH